MVADVDAISIKASVWNTAKARTKKPKKKRSTNGVTARENWLGYN